MIYSPAKKPILDSRNRALFSVLGSHHDIILVHPLPVRYGGSDLEELKMLLFEVINPEGFITFLILLVRDNHVVQLVVLHFLHCFFKCYLGVLWIWTWWSLDLNRSKCLIIFDMRQKPINLPFPHLKCVVIIFVAHIELNEVLNQHTKVWHVWQVTLQNLVACQFYQGWMNMIIIPLENFIIYFLVDECPMRL